MIKLGRLVSLFKRTAPHIIVDKHLLFRQIKIYVCTCDLGYYNNLSVHIYYILNMHRKWSNLLVKET